MDPVITSLLTGFPVLMLHFAVTLAMLGAGITIYHFITPYHEIRLIRAGNAAAAVSFSGALLGLAMPLAFTMASSVNVLDIVLWGVVALLIQLLAYRFADLLLKNLPKRIEAGEMSAAITVAAVKFAVATINAAAVSG